MNAERLLAHYEQIAEAPDAISRLRRFILELAVRGKLVPQDPKDEPVSDLLKRIAKDKVRLLNAGKIRKRDELPEINGADVPFNVPSTWRWCRFGNLGSTQTGTTPPKAKPEHYGGHIPFIKPGDIYPSHVDYSNEGLSKIGIDGSGRLACPGSILMVCIGTIGKCQRIDRDCSFNQQINSLSPYGETESRYLLIACQSEFFQKCAWAASARTTIAILNKGNWELLPLPIPPIAEQRRIVTKVDKLMVLCDQLEAARANREAVRDRLVAASLARLNAPDPETLQADARLALDALPALTTRPDQLKQLRQTILRLAVRGKLVPQDPKDEPASELLRRIAADKAERAVSVRDKRATKIKPLVGDESPYAIPSNWVWASFGEITISRDGERIPVSREERDRREKLYDYYGASGVIDKIDGYLFDKPLLLIGEDGANLINRSTPIAFIARGQYWVNNHAHVLDGLSEEFLRYVEMFINAIDLKPYVTGTAQPKMNQAKMNSIPVALPPLSEQRRIVAKVDELMVLSEKLEANLTVAADTRRRLLDALLAEALAPVGVAEREAAE